MTMDVERREAAWDDGARSAVAVEAHMRGQERGEARSAERIAQLEAEIKRLRVEMVGEIDAKIKALVGKHEAERALAEAREAILKVAGAPQLGDWSRLGEWYELPAVRAAREGK